jgi:lipopolysaccharide export LptBFGC system permease protein LptF
MTKRYRETDWSGWSIWFVRIKNFTWILMAGTLFYLFVFVSPQYLTYKEEKQKFKEEAAITKEELSAKDDIIKNRDKTIVTIRKDRDATENKRYVAQKTLNEIERQRLINEEKRRNFEQKDTLTNEELETKLNKRFDGLIDNDN